MNPVAEEAVQKWGGYLNFQDTFVRRNLQSYAWLVKSGSSNPPIPPPMMTIYNFKQQINGFSKLASVDQTVHVSTLHVLVCSYTKVYL